MDATTVIEVVTVLRSSEVRHWISGGWGIDALVGRQTRPHADLDLAVIPENVAVAALEKAGFEITIDWRPGRLVMKRADGTQVDLHPLAFDDPTLGIQRTWDGIEFQYPIEELITGKIAGREVPCISAALQRKLHQGYEPTAVDIADMKARDAAGL